MMEVAEQSTALKPGLRVGGDSSDYELVIFLRERRIVELPREGSLIVGRERGVDVCILHPSVSRRHLRITCGAAGLFLEDLGSRNGTRLTPFGTGTREDDDNTRTHHASDDPRLPPGRPIPFEPGDVARIGSVVLRLQQKTVFPSELLGETGTREVTPLNAPQERDRILSALNNCGGNQTRAAKMLGMSRRTLVNRLNELELPRPRKPA